MCVCVGGGGGGGDLGPTMWLIFQGCSRTMARTMASLQAGHFIFLFRKDTENWEKR